MIRNGFIKVKCGDWCNLETITLIGLHKDNLKQVYVWGKNGNKALLDEFLNEKDAQEWLDKIMCGEV